MLKENIIIFFLSCCLIIWSIPYGIFWDNITFVSAMGNALYENGVWNWMSITPEIDPGHPPFMAVLVATVWSIFGKSLWITHLMMLPFVFGLLTQLYKTVCYFVKDRLEQFLAFFIVLIDPTLLAQLVSVNPEVPLLFFFFLALNGVLYQHSNYRTIGLLFLAIVSFRGMMLGVGLFIVDIILHKLLRKESLLSFYTPKNLITYTLSVIPVASYLIWRLVYKGWLFSNPLQPWGDSTDYSDESGFLYNLISNITICIHRYLDFGRISIFITILIILLFFRKRIDLHKFKVLLVISVFSVIVIILTSLSINNPMGHRYFIPSYLMFTLLCFTLLFHTNTKTLTKYSRYKKGFIYTCLVLSLLGGNFIIYPDKISQGWDASLAHLHYFNLRDKAIDYLEDNEIKIEETASFFPNNVPIDVIDLNGDQRAFTDFTGQELYVIYSNVYNIKDREYSLLQNEYKLLETFKRFGVRIEIFEKK